VKRVKRKVPKVKENLVKKPRKENLVKKQKKQNPVKENQVIKENLKIVKLKNVLKYFLNVITREIN